MVRTEDLESFLDVGQDLVLGEGVRSVSTRPNGRFFCMLVRFFHVYYQAAVSMFSLQASSSGKGDQEYSL